MPVSPWSHSLAAVALVSAIPLVVMLLLSWNPGRVHHVLPQLVPFAAGALLGAALFHLVPEALRGAAPLRVFAIMGAGYFLFFAVDRLLHRDARPIEVSGAAASHSVIGDVVAATRARHLLPLTMAGDALHNVIDGMLIAAAYMDNPSLGLLTGAAIALHELPRELGTFALLVRGGTSVLRALLFNALTAAGAVAGAVATLVVGTRVEAVGTALVPFAAGNFLYLGGAIALAEFRDPARRGFGVKLMMAALGLLLTAAALGHGS